MSVRRAGIERRFWVLWVFASITSFAIGGAAHFPFGFGGSGFSAFNIPAAVVGAGFGAVAGVVIGILQWLVLRRAVSQAGWWVLASIAGVSLGHAFGDAAPDWLPFGMLASFGGAAIGTMQWLCLRGRVSQAGWWVLASTVSWFLGLAVGVTIADAIGLMTLVGFGDWLQYAIPHAFVGGVAGAVTGVITGFVLVWLLQRSVTGPTAMGSPP